MELKNKGDTGVYVCIIYDKLLAGFLLGWLFAEYHGSYATNGS